MGYGDYHVDGDDKGAVAFSCFYILLGSVGISFSLSHVVNSIFDAQEKVVADDDDDDGGGGGGGGGSVGMLWRRMLASIAMFCMLLLLGAFMFQFCEEGDGLFIDALYFSISSLTTVGYGDRVGKSVAVKVFSLVWLATGTLSLGRMLAAVIEYRLHRRVGRLRERLLQRKYASVRSRSELDMDGDHKIDRFEFLAYHLVEGEWNVGRSDIEHIMERYDELRKDVPQGFL